MDIKESYNQWADQYDTNVNKTRDMEGLALRRCLADISFRSCLEVGCGTGKNTAWLLSKAESVIAVDFSDQMLSKAKEKITSPNVTFIHADINRPWTFTNELFDLITFSLVLEHVEDIEGVFKKSSEKIKPDGCLYLGELHPFRQYSGSKAKYQTEHGEQTVPCFTHNISDFIQAAKTSGFSLLDVKEYFDDNDKAQIPRLLTMAFKAG